MQRFFGQRRTEGYTFVSVVRRERETTSHKRDGADTVPQTSDVQQRRDVSHTIRSSLHQLRRRSCESQLRCRNFSRAQLVFEPVDLDVSRPPVLVSCFKVEERESAPARRIAFGTRKRERYLRSRRRGKPLAPVKTKTA